MKSLPHTIQFKNFFFFYFNKKMTWKIFKRCADTSDTSSPSRRSGVQIRTKALL